MRRPFPGIRVPAAHVWSHAVFLAMALPFVQGCAETTTEPLGPSSAEVALPASLTSAPSGLVTVVHRDASYEDVLITVSSAAGIPISLPSGKTIATVPRFDASLGQLVQARLVIEGWLVTSVRSHGVNPIYISSQYGAAFRARGSVDPHLASLIGDQEIELALSFSGFHEDLTTEPSLGGIFITTLDLTRRGTRTYEFDRTYADAAAQRFVSQQPHDDLRMFASRENFLSASASQSGLSFDELFVLQTSPPTASSKPGIGTLVQVVAGLILADLGHDLFFADVHAAAAAQFQMQVTYVYMPNRPPLCSEAIASVQELWPPDGRLVPVEIMGVTDPDGDDVSITVSSIMQDEPVDGRGDGASSPDGVGIGTATAQVRAERSGNGDGRTYHIGFRAEDGRGGECSGSVPVNVRHNVRRPAVDGGALHDSTSGS